MTLAFQLAQLVTAIRVGDIPPLALERAKMSLASTVASCAMGFDIASTKVIRAIEIEMRAHLTQRFGLMASSCL